jgi:hypothetical protein
MELRGKMANTYEAIATNTVVGTGTSSVAFSSIPATYTDLVLVSWVAFQTGPSNYCKITFNSQTSGYNWVYMRGSSSTKSSVKSTGQANLQVVVSGDTTTRYAANETHIMSYASTTTGKGILNRANMNGLIEQSAGNWANTSAINSIQIVPNSGNFQDGCNFTLYGILRA